jgi:hypothetical protein
VTQGGRSCIRSATGCKGEQNERGGPAPGRRTGSGPTRPGAHPGAGGGGAAVATPVLTSPGPLGRRIRPPRRRRHRRQHRRRPPAGRRSSFAYPDSSRARTQPLLLLPPPPPARATPRHASNSRPAAPLPALASGALAGHAARAPHAQARRATPRTRPANRDPLPPPPAARDPASYVAAASGAAAAAAGAAAAAAGAAGAGFLTGRLSTRESCGRRAGSARAQGEPGQHVRWTWRATDAAVRALIHGGFRRELGRARLTLNPHCKHFHRFSSSDASSRMVAEEGAKHATGEGWVVSWLGGAVWVAGG